jgi:hypothetical protein
MTVAGETTGNRIIILYCVEAFRAAAQLYHAITTLDDFCPHLFFMTPR